MAILRNWLSQRTMNPGHCQFRDHGALREPVLETATFAKF